MRLQVAKLITMEAKGLFKSESAIKICRALVILIGVISSPCTQPGFFLSWVLGKWCRAVGLAEPPPSGGEVALSSGHVVVGGTWRAIPSLAQAFCGQHSILGDCSSAWHCLGPGLDV